MLISHKLMSCSQGHFWESPESAPAPMCPVCGGAPESLPLISVVAADEAEIEVPPAETVPATPGRPSVPGYEIVEERGRTATGVVLYLAKQDLVPRSVLLKVVKAAEDRGQRAWGALRGEAVALAKIAHPNVVQLYEAGDNKRELFYNAVEFIDGPTLAQKWSAKPLPPRQAAALIEVLARALQHAHDRGIVHRALRPAAVKLQLYKSEGSPDEVVPPFCRVHSMRCIPKLTDFGLARRPVEGDVNDLDLQQGPPFYLAPEQVWGRSKEIGPGTDIYALGVILYELVCGEPPFLGPGLSEILDQIQSRPARAPGGRCTRVPRDLAAICLKCLEKHHRYRYRGAEALADDLRRFLNGQPVKARPIGPIRSLGRAARRRPGVTALVILSVVLAGILGTMRRGLPALPLPPAAYRAQVPSPSGPIEPPTAPIDRNAHYIRNLTLAQRAIQAREFDQAARFLRRCSLFQRAWEWYALAQSARRKPPSRLASNPASVYRMECSSDGRFVAVLGRANQNTPSLLSVWNAFGQEVFRADSGGRERTAVTWSADSSCLFVMLSSGEVVGIDPGILNSNKPPNHNRIGTRYFWRGHSTATLGVRWGNDQLTGAIADGERLQFIEKDRFYSDISAGGNVVCLACCAPRNYFAAGDRDGRVHIWDMASARRLHLLEGHIGAVTALAFTMDGRRLVSGGKDGALSVWDPEEGREIVRLPGPKGGIDALAFQADGHRLAVASDCDIDIWGDDN